MNDLTTPVPDEGTQLGDGLRVIGTPEARAKLFGELAKATAKFQPILKSRHVKFRTQKGEVIEYDYATYADLRKATDDALAEHSLACVSFPHGMASYLVTTVLAGHGAEVWATQKPPLPQYLDIKILGGLQTYLARYGYAKALGLEGELDADEFPDEALKPAPKPEPPKAQPKRAARGQKPEPAEASTPKADEPLWTTDQQKAITEHSMRLGFIGNQEGFRALVAEFLGHPIQRTSRKQPVMTEAEADMVIDKLANWSPTGSDDDLQYDVPPAGMDDYGSLESPR